MILNIINVNDGGLQDVNYIVGSLSTATYVLLIVFENRPSTHGWRALMETVWLE